MLVHDLCFAKIENGFEIDPFKCRQFCDCESTKLQQGSTEFNKQAANGSTRIT
jgi:hypothetical protein